MTTTNALRALKTDDRIRGSGLGRRSGRRLSEQRAYPAWFLVPAFALLIVFFFAPNVMNFVYAFTNWSAYSNTIAPVGLANFATLLSGGDLVRDVGITIVYAALVAAFQNGIGLALALLLERDTRINRFARSMFFIPVLMSALAVGYMFQAILKPNGALNAAIGALVHSSVQIAWLDSTSWTVVVVALVNTWKWVGLTMLIYLAGLKTISPDILEAARIDGASWFRTFRWIRFPLLAPAVTFNVATGLLGSMNSFDVVQATTMGGPAQSTEVLNIFIYRMFGQGLYGEATAMSLSLLVVVAALAFPVIIYLRHRENVL